MLASINDREGIRCFFPHLHERTSPVMTEDDLREFYEKGIRPAIARLAPQSLADWPPTYDAEVFRASKPTVGGFSWGTKVIPRWGTLEFGELLRQSLQSNAVDWADDMVFQIQVRGVKNGSFHACRDDAVTEALDVFLDGYDIDPNDQWFIDVGLEFSIPNERKALLWRTDCHTHVVSHLLNGDLQLATQSTKFGSRTYSRDLSSHLADVSGCRIEMGAFANNEVRNPHSIHYIQLYTTDKAVTYQIAGGKHSKHLTPKAAFKGDPPQFVRGLFDAYMDAAMHTEVNARIEVRVPLQHASIVLSSWPNDLLSRTMVMFNRERWW
jgi:hypothetical protein